MGSESRLITMTGRDPEGDRVAEILAASGVSARQLKVQGVQTVTRHRFFVYNPGAHCFEFLFRVDKDPDPSSYARAEEVITKDGFLDWFEGEAETANVILFNDTDKGFLSRSVLLTLESRIREVGERRASKGLKRPIVVLDPKTEWEKYKGLTVDILKPNHIEACMVTHLPDLDFREDSNLMKLVNRLYEMYREHFPSIVVTLGPLGAAAIKCHEPGPTVFRHPAIPSIHTDSGVATHCGDMFASALALSLTVDCDLPSAIDFANCVGSLQVSMRTGKKVTRSDLTSDAFVEHVRANYASPRLVSNARDE